MTWQFMHVSGASSKYDVTRAICAKSSPVPQKTPNRMNAGTRSPRRRKLNFKSAIAHTCIFRNIFSVFHENRGPSGTHYIVRRSTKQVGATENLQVSKQVGCRPCMFNVAETFPCDVSMRFSLSCPWAGKGKNRFPHRRDFDSAPPKEDSNPRNYKTKRNENSKNSSAEQW